MADFEIQELGEYNAEQNTDQHKTITESSVDETNDGGKIADSTENHATGVEKEVSSSKNDLNEQNVIGPSETIEAGNSKHEQEKIQDHENVLYLDHKENDDAPRQDRPASKARKKRKMSTKLTAKVEPSPKVEENTEKTEAETDKVTKEQNLKGVQLLHAVNEKNKKLAFKLIEEGADIYVKDSAKCTALHYASVHGLDDIVIKLIEKGSSVKDFDENGETALHKASRAGNESTVVVLLGFKSDVHTLNWEGRTPLELAVLNRHVTVFEVLCLAGADLVMQDWTWIERTMVSKDKTDKALMAVLEKHMNRLSGYQHEGITHTIEYIDPGKETKLKNLGLHIPVANNSHQSRYFLYFAKIQVEYTDMKKILKEDQELFSDIYEMKTWGASPTDITFNVRVKGVPKCNEVVNIVSPGGNIGQITSIERDEDKNRTQLKVTVHLKPKSQNTFMFVTIEKPEVFNITNAACTIQPQMEPEAEIDIPPDTFEEAGDLMLNMVETKDVNSGEKETQEELTIVTNVLDLSMSNHQQPKQPIDMKLPMHSDLEEDDEIVILSSSKEYPEEEDDWEIVEARKGRTRRNCNVAAFQISHFSIFTGVSKKKLQKDMKAVTILIQAALHNERPVEFFALTKSLPRDEFAVVIECSLKRKARNRKRYWRRKDYDLQDLVVEQTVLVNQWFRLSFGGNVKRMGSDQSETQKLMFQPNRENFQVFSVELDDKKNAAIGHVKIELIEEVAQEPIETIGEGGCFGSKVILVEQEPKLVFSELTSLPIHLHVQKEEDSDENLGEIKSQDDIQCTIKVLEMPSLVNLARVLNSEEAFHLAMQIKAASPPELAEKASEHPKVDDFLYNTLKLWRGDRPYKSMVNTLANVLDTMGKEAEALELREAHKEKRHLCFY